VNRAGHLVLCTASLALLAACSSSKPAPVVTVTVPFTQPAPPGGASAAGSGTDTSTTAPSSPSAPPSRVTKLNGTCDTLLPDYSISQALGGAQLAGATAFVVGQAERNIGRISYLNCRYGLTGRGSAAQPKVEIGVSLYTTAAKAAARVSATADDYTGHGATSADTPVGGHTGQMLTGGVGAGYDVPLLVVASGQRTVAVSVDSSVATGAKATADAVSVATLALKRTGG
jgi:hypothetical protein